MKCPMKFKIEDMWGEKQRIYSGDCLKEECAWWVTFTDIHNVTFEGCAIKGLWEVSLHMVQKMPSPEFFKK